MKSTHPYQQALNIEFAPPPLPSLDRKTDASPMAGRTFAVTSMVVFAIGIPPMLFFILLAGTGDLNFFVFLIMGCVGFVFHTLALISGIVGVAMGSNVMGICGALGNGIILLICILTFFMAIVA